MDDDNRYQRELQRSWNTCQPDAMTLRTPWEIFKAGFAGGVAAAENEAMQAPAVDNAARRLLVLERTVDLVLRQYPRQAADWQDQARNDALWQDAPEHLR